MEELNKILTLLNQRGIRMPMLTDPKTGIASVTLTMMFISFNLVVIGVVSKWSKFLGDVDMSAAMGLFITTGGMYLGRRFQNNGKNVTLEEKDKNE